MRKIQLLLLSIMFVFVFVGCKSGELPSVTITFDSNGGSSVQQEEVKMGSSFALPESPTKENYVFAGWYKDQSLTTSFPEGTVVDASLTLYAKWKTATYTITYNVNDATTGTAPASQTKTYGTDVQLSAKEAALVKTDYDFAGWNTKADGTGTYYAENAAYSKEENVTLYAAWTPFTFEQIQESGVTVAYKVTGLISDTATFTNPVIPDIYNGLPVTEVAADALNGKTNLKGSLTLGNNLATIGARAFVSCKGLTGNLTLPSSLTSLGNYAFAKCSGISGDLLVPDSVTSCGYQVFDGDTFTNITIKMPTIANSTFNG